MIEKIGERSFGLFMLGHALIALSIGSVYSRWFIRSAASFAAYIAATLLATFYITTVIQNYKRSTQVKAKTHFVGFVGSFLLILFFGIQSPHLPGKIYLFAAGALLVVPAGRDLIFGGGGE